MEPISDWKIAVVSRQIMIIISCLGFEIRMTTFLFYSLKL